MKHIEVETDWLAAIDGTTVAQAIAYLQTLDPTHSMTYWQSKGDDHGVEISSNLYYQRELTEEEHAAETKQRKRNKISELTGTILYYEGVLSRPRPIYAVDDANYNASVDSAAARIAVAKAELETLK